MDSSGKKAGKGPLIQEEVSATLGTTQDQYLFQAIVENHPHDSRVTVDDSGTVQTLTKRMGTGGGNVPLAIFSKVKRAQSSTDFETWKESNCTNTLNTFDMGDIRATDLVVINLNKDDVQSKQIIDPKGIAPPLYSGECRFGGGELYVIQPVICIQGNHIDRDTKQNGKGYIEDKSYTLTEADKHGVCYAVETFHVQAEERKTPPNQSKRLQRPHSYCIGNGQVNDAVGMEKEICKTLNCMDDPMKILIVK